MPQRDSHGESFPEKRAISQSRRDRLSWVPMAPAMFFREKLIPQETSHLGALSPERSLPRKAAAAIPTIKKAWGKPIKPKSIMVSAYTRNMNLPERSFLRTALREMTPEIQAEIDKALQL